MDSSSHVFGFCFVLAEDAAMATHGCGSDELIGWYCSSLDWCYRRILIQAGLLGGISGNAFVQDG